MESKVTVGDMMEAYALDAIDHARKATGAELDFSLESVEKAEAILATMFDARPKSIIARLFARGPSSEQVDTFSKIYGGYVGEVLRRHLGGEWFFDTEILPGANVIGLRKADVKIWPPAKVAKRLTNGPEDNVWLYFQVIQEKWPPTR